MPKIQVPTEVRCMSEAEHKIVRRVLGAKLPLRQRIWITNGYTEENRAFVIPTSVITTLFGTALGGLPGFAIGYLSSCVNLGYLINVGNRFTDLTTIKDNRRLLVHETVHVWQGYNGLLANSFFAEAMWCHATLGEDSYDYKPGKEWSSYNPEQQANIVQQWFLDGENESGELWPYIRDNFREPKRSTLSCAEYEETMAVTCKK